MDSFITVFAFLIVFLSFLVLSVFAIVIGAIIALVFFIVKKLDDAQKEYEESSYFQITKLPYHSVQNNKGRNGEFLIYKCLKKMEENGAKFLFNVYLPKEDGQTTEIDVLMICSKGIFVFESKNYSGWIFGNESQKNWHQTLRGRRGRSQVEHFYNPIMQNRSHINYLKRVLGNQIPMHSVIVFSNRCTLKKLQIKSTNVSIIKLNHVFSVVSDICNRCSVNVLSETSISEIYNKLYPFTQVDKATKTQHIANIQSKLSNIPTQQTVNRIVPSDSSQITPTIAKVEKSKTTTNIQQESQSFDAIDKSDQIEVPHTVVKLNSTTLPTSQQNQNCPHCGSNLMRISTKTGTTAGKQFYGCSNYPQCPYIQNIPLE